MENLTTKEVQEFLIIDYLKKETGNSYCFAVSSVRTWNVENNVEKAKDSNSPFYQLMPDSFDTGFFVWYSQERPHNQFFEIKENAFTQFLKYWKIWNSNQKES